MEVKTEDFEDVHSVCIVCCQHIRTTDLYTSMHPQFQPAEKLTDLFKVFCKYMSWEAGQLDFNFNRESFPFCVACKSALISIYRMHGIVQNVLKEINQITTDVLAKLLHSKDKNDEVSLIIESAGDDGRKRAHLKKVKQLRNFAFSRCSPTVRVEQILHLEVRSDSEQNSSYEPIEVQVVDPEDNSLFLDDCPADSPFESNDIDSEGQIDEDVQEKKEVEMLGSVRNSLEEVTKEKKIKKLSVNFGGKLYSFNYDGTVFKCSLCDFTTPKKIELLKHAGKDHFAKNQDLARKPLKRPNQQTWSGTIVGKKLKRQKKGSKIAFGKKFMSHVHQIDERRFIFDKKYPFELNSDNKWYCTTCDRQFFSKYTMEHHLMVRKCKANSENINDPDVTLQSEESGSESDDGKLCLMYDKFPVTCSVRGWKCGTCGEVFGSKSTIQHHVLAVCKGLNEENDRSCVETEENKFLYSKKYPFEFAEGSFKCGTCEITLKTQYKMLAHISKVHIEGLGRDVNHMVEISPNQFLYANKFYAEKAGDVFRCCSCGYTTKLRHSLTKHLYHKHLNDRKHICDTCGKNFQMMCHLRTHQMRVHKGDKFYKKMIHVCDICGKLFGSKTEWNWHTEEHKDVNVVGVPCEICGKHVYRHKMRMHIRGHEKMFECKDCDKRFVSKWYLSVHLKTHGGAKPFECDVCGTKFAQKSSIRKHKIKLHELSGEDLE